jgi:hypothetical protein
MTFNNNNAFSWIHCSVLFNFISSVFQLFMSYTNSFSKICQIKNDVELQWKPHLMFLKLKFSLIHNIQFQWFQVNNVHFKFPPFKILFTLLFRSTACQRNSEQAFTNIKKCPLSMRLCITLNLIPNLYVKSFRRLYLKLQFFSILSFSTPCPL